MLLGDRRTGQQLLDDAAADALRTIGRATQSRAGTAALNQIAAYLEARLSDVEQVLQAGGRAGGLWRSPWDQWRGPCSAAQASVILHPSRPIAHDRRGVRLDGDGPTLPFMTRLHLAQPGARWAWSLGLDAARLMSIISAVPLRLADAMRRLLAAKHRAAQAATQRLAVASAAVWPVSLVSAGAEYLPQHQLKPPPDEDEEAMWEEAEVALLLLDLDPATQRRVRVTCSAGAAQLWGQHREEWLARFAAHEGRVPFTDLGGLCALLADACGDGGSGVVLYHRFCIGHGPDARAVLVCGCKSREFDSLGRVRQVDACAGSFPPSRPFLPPSPSTLVDHSLPSILTPFPPF